jgi:hypothetical protein
MNNSQNPNWQPIRNLPMIADMIDGQYTETKNQLKNLLEARKKPHVLDDATIERILKVFTEQQEFVPIFGEQLSKWQQEETLTTAHQKEVDRLQVQVELWKKGLTDILALAEELKMGTIEKVMQKSDLELGMEHLKKFF